MSIVATAIGKRWKKFGILLGFTWEEIEAFDVDHASLGESITAMLVDWKQRTAELEPDEQKQKLEDARRLVNIPKTGNWNNRFIRKIIGKVYF